MTEAPDRPTTPRPSATILLLRDGPEGLEVLMQQRHEEVGVFSGALTFPGGKVVPEDSSAQVRARADGVETHSDDELAFAASAVRETFEECGVLLAREAAGGPLVGGDRAAATFDDRPALDAGELALGDFLEKHDLRLALDEMTPFSHWITPVSAPRRFDTWFYLAAVPEGQVPDAESKETVEMIWIRPQAAPGCGGSRRTLALFRHPSECRGTVPVQHGRGGDRPRPAKDNRHRHARTGRNKRRRAAAPRRGGGLWALGNPAARCRRSEADERLHLPGCRLRSELDRRDRDRTDWKCDECQ